MSDHRQRLLEILKSRSFRRGHFRLASGGVSDYFIDAKMTQVHSEGAYLIGEILYEMTRDLEIDAIGGLQVGSIPLTTAAVVCYQHHGREMEGFWMREEVKDHGTQKRIEGRLLPGSRVVIVDDVFTTGGSTMKAVDAVRELGCEVVTAIALVDRLQGAGNRLLENCIDPRAIFTIRDFGVVVPTI